MNIYMKVKRQTRWSNKKTDRKRIMNINSEDVPDISIDENAQVLKQMKKVKAERKVGIKLQRIYYCK